MQTTHLPQTRPACLQGQLSKGSIVVTSSIIQSLKNRCLRKSHDCHVSGSSRGLLRFERGNRWHADTLVRGHAQRLHASQEKEGQQAAFKAASEEAAMRNDDGAALIEVRGMPTQSSRTIDSDSFERDLFSESFSGPDGSDGNGGFQSAIFNGTVVDGAFLDLRGERESPGSGTQGLEGEGGLRRLWDEYDDAVEEKNLDRALYFLQALKVYQASEPAVQQKLLAVALDDESLSQSPIDVFEQVSVASGRSIVDGDIEKLTNSSPFPEVDRAWSALVLEDSRRQAAEIVGLSPFDKSLDSSTEAKPEEGILSRQRGSSLFESRRRARANGVAFEFPQTVDILPSGESAVPLSEEVQRRYLRVLDIGLAAEDAGEVAGAYRWLQGQGLLRNFGRFQPAGESNSRIPRLVTPSVLKLLTGVEASRLSPTKWGSSTTWAPIALFAGISALVNNGVEVRPLLVVLAGLAIADATYLGGTGFVQLLSSVWKPYRRRILVHEAGHVLVAYLLGCPVRGVVLGASEAIRSGIQGQAGTQFWDGALEQELQEGRLLGATIDRYCIVLFAGIAAEALVYGKAEGGENDENLFKTVVGQLQPVWSPAKISNQARWAVAQALLLLRAQQRAHEAVVLALERGAQMGEIAAAIESAIQPLSA
eukprot:TRINITY_DN38391_c0_g1_i1.p1 TRINITY_DN38391_c0_g1~~TRINITY_DN38391_c0_g1_i1.p1  ORF type:complete len:650 (+),score=92.15 TRINITY_DN38391_c0_g1_i1:228-2177(+)